MQSYIDLLEALDRGGSCRATASTNMNSQPSRSHAIFTIYLHKIICKKNDKKDSENITEIKENNNENNNKKSSEMVIQSKFHFVDLAGSERIKKNKSNR